MSSSSERLGWLTESSTLPRRRRVITGVSSTSQLQVQAALYEREASLGAEGAFRRPDASHLDRKRRKLQSSKSLSMLSHGVSECLEESKEHATPLHLVQRVDARNNSWDRMENRKAKKNRGVEERENRDRLAFEKEKADRENPYERLQEKAKLYESLQVRARRGEQLVDEKGEELLVDFEAKAWNNEKVETASHSSESDSESDDEQERLRFVAERQRERELEEQERRRRDQIEAERKAAERREENRHLLREIGADTEAARSSTLDARDRRRLEIEARRKAIREKQATKSSLLRSMLDEDSL